MRRPSPRALAALVVLVVVHLALLAIATWAFGDARASQPNPPARLIEAVARDEIDVAIAWGPLAGYFAPRPPVELEIVPVSPQIDLPFLPFVFDIALGVRRGEDEFRLELERAMAKRRPEIDSILVAYGVPLMTRTSRTARAP